MFDTVFLRFVAVILITNSHLDSFYPIKALASGGSLGNSLFFMLSGLGLALSAKSRSMPFGPWLRYRLGRIYPAVWIVVLVVPLILLEGWRQWGVGDYVFHLFYPTTYWFISALAVFYVLMYPLLYFCKRHHLKVLIAFLMIPYFYFYFTMLDLSVFSIENGSCFKWIFYFQIVLFGMLLAQHYQTMKETEKRPDVMDLAGFILVVAIYLALKLVIAQGHFTQFQFLVQWITFPFVFFALRLSQYPWLKKLEKMPLLGSLIATLGACTLEIYLLQHHLYTLPFLQQLAFPLNLVVFTLMLLPLAVLLNHLAKPVCRIVGGRS